MCRAHATAPWINDSISCESGEDGEEMTDLLVVALAAQVTHILLQVQCLYFLHHRVHNKVCLRYGELAHVGGGRKYRLDSVRQVNWWVKLGDKHTLYAPMKRSLQLALTLQGLTHEHICMFAHNHTAWVSSKARMSTRTSSLFAMVGTN